MPLQTGALPWRLSKSRKLEVLLVTGRRSGRWMIPKGWPMIGKSLADAAALEAFEEAGINGIVDPRPLGSFHRSKRGFFGTTHIEILVHALLVEKELSDWPERGERDRQWFSLEKAFAAVESDELRELISNLARQINALQAS